MSEARYKIKTLKSGEYYWILVAPNGQTIATSWNIFRSIPEAKNSIAGIRKHALTEAVIDEKKEP